MARRQRESVAAAEQEQKVQGNETQAEPSAAEQVAAKCDELKGLLKASAMLYHELELVGAAKRVRAEHDKMDGRKEKLVKRVEKSGTKEEREAKKAAKREERIAKLKAQLAALTDDEEEE